MVVEENSAIFYFKARKVEERWVLRKTQSGGEMTAGVTTLVMTEEQLFAEEVYSRLPEAMEYVAAYWFEGLLQPLEYERCDQSRVAHAIHYLVGQGRLTRESVRPATGYHNRAWRSSYPKPRRVAITKISNTVSV